MALVTRAGTPIALTAMEIIVTAIIRNNVLTAVQAAIAIAIMLIQAHIVTMVVLEEAAMLDGRTHTSAKPQRGYSLQAGHKDIISTQPVMVTGTM